MLIDENYEGEQYENIIWPCKISPYLKKVSRKVWNITWTVCVKNLNLEELNVLKQYKSINLDESWLMKEGGNFKKCFRSSRKKWRMRLFLRKRWKN